MVVPCSAPRALPRLTPLLRSRYEKHFSKSLFVKKFSRMIKQNTPSRPWPWRWQSGNVWLFVVKSKIIGQLDSMEWELVVFTHLYSFIDERVRSVGEQSRIDPFVHTLLNILCHEYGKTWLST
jgi:hypothetical protein